MDKTISHQGVVEQVLGQHIQVKIISTSACSSCHAKGACSVSDTSEKIIDATTLRSGVKPGDLVTVTTRQSSGFKAVFWGYGLPFLVVLSVMIFTKIAGLSETQIGLLALLSLAPYYTVLYLFRNKIQKTFQFEVK